MVLLHHPGLHHAEVGRKLGHRAQREEPYQPVHHLRQHLSALLGRMADAGRGVRTERSGGQGQGDARQAARRTHIAGRRNHDLRQHDGRQEPDGHDQAAVAHRDVGRRRLGVLQPEALGCPKPTWCQPLEQHGHLTLHMGDSAKGASGQSLLEDYRINQSEQVGQSGQQVTDHLPAPANKETNLTKNKAS